MRATERSFLIGNMFFGELGHQLVNSVRWAVLEKTINDRMPYLMGQYPEIYVIH